MMKPRTTILVAATLAGLFVADSASAQLPNPRLYAVNPPGGKAGATIDLTITSGEDLDDVTALRFSHPGISAAPKMGEPNKFQPQPAPIEGRFTVTIAADVPPGVYEVRAVGRFGVSSSRAFTVGARDEIVVTQHPGDQANPLDIALDAPINHVAQREQTAYFRFEAKKGQRIIIDCQARRIDSRLNGTMVLFDAAGRELMRDGNTNRRDPLLDFTAPADGKYVLSVFDHTYDGGPEHFCRITLHTGPYVDFVFPPAWKAGETGEFTVYGRNLPGSTPAEGVAVKGVQLEKLTTAITMPTERTAPHGLFVAPAEAPMDAIAWRLPTPGGPANPVRVAFAGADVRPEAEPNNDPAQPQKITPPVEIAGQFYPHRDEDWFTFEAKKGDSYRIEVVCQRVGNAADPYLLVQRLITNDKGETTAQDLAEADDARNGLGGDPFDMGTTDPIHAFTAPEDGVYRIFVRDHEGGARDDARQTYRLIVRPQQPDFAVIACARAVGERNVNESRASVPWAASLRRGGAVALDVTVVRSEGFDGPVTVAAENLPTGVTADPVAIPGWANTVRLVLRAATDAPAWTGPLNLVARASIGEQETTKPVRGGQVVWRLENNRTRGFSRLTDDLTLSVVDIESVPFSVALGEGQPVAVDRGAKIKIPIKVERRDGHKGNIILKPIVPHNEIKAGNVTINGDQSAGEIELEIRNNVPPGAFTFTLEAETELNYKRNPDAAAKAAEQKKALDDQINGLKEAFAKAEQARQQAEQAVKNTGEELKKEQDKHKQLEQQIEKAKQEAKDAIESLKQLREQASQTTGDASLAQKVAEAEAKANEMSTRSAAAAQLKAAGDKALADAQGRSEKSAADLETLKKAAEQAKADLDAASNMAKQFDERIKKLAEAGKEQKIKVYAHAAPVVVQINEPVKKDK